MCAEILSHLFLCLITNTISTTTRITRSNSPPATPIGKMRFFCFDETGVSDGLTVYMYEDNYVSNNRATTMLAEVDKQRYVLEK